MLHYNMLFDEPVSVIVASLFQNPENGVWTNFDVLDPLKRELGHKPTFEEQPLVLCRRDFLVPLDCGWVEIGTPTGQAIYLCS